MSSQTIFTGEEASKIKIDCNLLRIYVLTEQQKKREADLYFDSDCPCYYLPYLSNSNKPLSKHSLQSGIHVTFTQNHIIYYQTEFTLLHSSFWFLPAYLEKAPFRLFRQYFLPWLCLTLSLGRYQLTWKKPLKLANRSKSHHPPILKRKEAIK